MNKIKKIRKRIKSVQLYSVRQTSCLFGDFFGSNRLILKHNDIVISASSPKRAIIIYMRRYRLYNKKKSDYERREYRETSEMWGTIMVTDEKGFKTFWK